MGRDPAPGPGTGTESREERVTQWSETAMTTLPSTSVISLSLAAIFSSARCVSVLKQPHTVSLTGYHSHDQLEDALESLAEKYDFVKTYDIGQSVQGRSLPVIKFVTAEPRPSLKPMVKYAANMHGNEVRQ